MEDNRRFVLDALNSGPVPGPALAAELDISRTAVWKHIDALRTAGFTVRPTDEGYAVTAVPEFGGLAVAFGLDAPFDIEYHESIRSTNERARELAAGGARECVVLADEQTRGHGRLDRGWHSPSGGIWMSVLLRPDVPPARVPLLTLAAAVAVTEAVRESGTGAAIKWPNDVIVGEQKLAGILTEMGGEVDRVSWVVIGIGLNANVLPDELPARATSLLAEGGAVERRLVVQRILEAFDALRTDVDETRDRWRTHAATLGQRVRVETTDGVVEGEAIDVTASGALVVETTDGPTPVHVGDCEHLRPA